MKGKARRLSWGRCVPTLLMAAAFSAGCGDDSDRIYFGAAAEAEWNWFPATADALGYTITVAVLQLRRDDTTCGALPSSTHVLINGEPTALTPQADTGCMAGGQVLGPFLHDQTVTVTVEEAGDVTATATFTNLLPGTAATMIGPSEVHEGDDLLILPVPEMPTASVPYFYLLDLPEWRSYGLSGKLERRSDGLHVQVPSFSGRAVLMLLGSLGTLTAGQASCPGFGVCKASCASGLGPFFVTGIP
jgi:hypothetical protein